MGPEDKVVSWDFPDDNDNSVASQSAVNGNALISLLEKVEKKGTSIRFTLPNDEDDFNPSLSLNQSSLDSASLSLANNNSTSATTSNSVSVTTTNSGSGTENTKTVQTSQPQKVQKGRFSIVESNATSKTSSSSSLNNPTEASKEEGLPAPLSTRNLYLFVIYSGT